MITKKEALDAYKFEYLGTVKPNGTPFIVRRNGKTKTWKTRPNEFKVPIKYGLYDYGYITDKNANDWRVAE